MSFAVSSLIWKGYSGAGGSEMVVMLALADWSTDDGYCHPSIASIARKARIQDRQAKRVVHSLIDSGWLAVVGNSNGGAPGASRRYRINIERLMRGDAQDTPTGVTDDTGVIGGMDGCHGGSKRGVVDDTQTCHRTNQEPVSKVSQAKPDRLPNCPSKKITDLYNEALPELPKARIATGKRDRLIQARWKWVLTNKREDGSRRATTADEAIEWFKGFFQRARDNDFIMGRTTRGAGHENWRADLDYLMSDRGLVQVVEKTGGQA